MTIRYGAVGGEFLIRLSGSIEHLGDLRRLAQNLCTRLAVRPRPVRLDLSEIRGADERLARFASFLEEWVLLELGQRFIFIAPPGLVVPEGHEVAAEEPAEALCCVA